MSVTTTLRSVVATRYVTPLREGGSLPGLVEADDDGLYVTKFRGAGQGLRALVAEVIVGELARTAGFLIPELVRVSVDPRLGAAEPDPEIQELILASEGENLGVDFLPGSLPYTPAGGWQPAPPLAAEIVWLDALTTNVDRTPRNPNLLLWHERLWLIDHGAALYLQHGGLHPGADAARPFPLIAEHVLLPGPARSWRRTQRLRARAARDGDRRRGGAGARPWFAGADPPRPTSNTCTRGCAAGGFAQEAEHARPRPSPFSYVILRVVPGVERGERLNVGVVLFCRQLRLSRPAGRARRRPAWRRSLPMLSAAERRAPPRRAGSGRRRGDPARRPIAALPRRSGSAGWSRRRARSSSPPRSTPGCAATRRPRWTRSAKLVRRVLRDRLTGIRLPRASSAPRSCGAGPAAAASAISSACTIRTGTAVIQGVVADAAQQ